MSVFEKTKDSLLVANQVLGDQIAEIARLVTEGFKFGEYKVFVSVCDHDHLL